MRVIGRCDVTDGGALASAGDGILVARAVDGDRVALETLIRRHAPYLRAYAIRLTGSRSDADDAVQETIITVWRRLDSLQDGDRFRAWATSILARTVTDLYRRRRPEADLAEHGNELLDHRSDPEAAAVVASEAEALASVLAALPAAQRQCWLLREVSGFSYEQIAEQVDADVSTVRGRIARARATVVREMRMWR